MIRILCVLTIVATVAVMAYGMLTLYDESLQIGRMWETPAIRPHEQPIAVITNDGVPYSRAELFYHMSDPNTLQPPFDLNSASTITAGQQEYRYYCIHCHGSNYDGYGTVGQSFAPPPGDLRSAKVQNRPPGQLFHEISYGIRGGRQPALASTISANKRWQIIGFIKSMGRRQDLGKTALSKEAH